MIVTLRGSLAMAAQKLGVGETEAEVGVGRDGKEYKSNIVRIDDQSPDYQRVRDLAHEWQEKGAKSTSGAAKKAANGHNGNDGAAVKSAVHIQPDIYKSLTEAVLKAVREQMAPEQKQLPMRLEESVPVKSVWECRSWATTQEAGKRWLEVLSHEPNGSINVAIIGGSVRNGNMDPNDMVRRWVRVK